MGNVIGFILLMAGFLYLATAFRGIAFSTPVWPTKKVVSVGFLGLLLAIVGWSLMALPTPAPTPEAMTQQAMETTQKNEACRKDLDCWSGRYKDDAQMACYPLIEEHARYDYEWDSWYRPDFSKVVWKKKPEGILAYWGEDIKFQNGFGAWRRMTYWCIYDPKSEKASVEVNPR